LNGSNMEKKEFLRQYPKICIDEDWQYWMADGSACAR